MGQQNRETGGASRYLAQRWLFQASAEGLGDLSMETISFILALAFVKHRQKAGGVPRTPPASYHTAVFSCKG